MGTSYMIKVTFKLNVERIEYMMLGPTSHCTQKQIPNLKAVLEENLRK